MLFYLSIGMTIFANLAYNLCQKTTASQAHPLVALSVTYTMALATCLIFYALTSRPMALTESLRQLNVSSYALGPAIVILEAGFILAFREGWNLGYAALVSNAAASLLLIPIAYGFFHESIRPSQYVGIVLTLFGLFLIVKRA
jgi:drug/metabolite transporter (DMT)-like permease